MVNTYFYKFEVITAHYGQGFDVLILAGTHSVLLLMVFCLQLLCFYT